MPHDDDLDVTALERPGVASWPPRRGLSRRARTLVAALVLLALLATLAVVTPLGHQVMAFVTGTPAPIASSNSTIATGEGDIGAQWQPLARRPVRVPHIVSGAPCSVSPVQQFSVGYGPGLGAGPVYPFPFATDGRIEGFEPPSPGQPEGRSLTMLLWAVPNTGAYPVLVRGARVDGNDPIYFNGGMAQISNAADWRTVPQLSALELQGFQYSASNWTVYPSYVRLRAPGCYAFQLDAPSFSRVLIFRAA